MNSFPKLLTSFPENRLDLMVTEAKNEASKGWFLTALIVGSFVVVGIGGSGILGLLKSYNLISLPDCLNSVIDAVGNVPQFWSLWAIATGGVLLGGRLILFGAYKAHKFRIVNEKLQNYYDIPWYQKMPS